MGSYMEACALCLEKCRRLLMEEILSLQFKGIPNSVFVISFLILSVLIVLVFMQRKNHRETLRSVLSMMLVVYVFLMFCSTVVCREIKETHNLELIPFWNYNDIFVSRNPMSYWEVLLNIILYSPIGFMIGCISKKLLPTILICVLLSVVTEVLQLVLHRGLCETNDVIHNTLGGFIGWSLYSSLRGRLIKLRAKKAIGY